MEDPTRQFRLDGKTALITGASAGLGARFARVLDAAGARVAIAARRAERLEELAAELNDAVVLPTDVGSDDSREALIDKASDQLGRIDVLVNNAGIDRVVAAIDEPIESIREVFEVNLVAPFDLSRLAARRAIEAAASLVIVNVGSILGEVGTGKPTMTSYLASKGGVHNLTRDLAAQWARYDIRVNTLAPGWFDTEMTHEGMFADERGYTWIKRKAPMRRAGEEHELDGALLFLCSEASTYVTGTTVFVDGGWTAV